MSDLDLPVRGRTYREPEGPHVAVARGRDLEVALEHLDSRPDCRALALLGLPSQVPDLGQLAGRRLFLWDADRRRLREFAEAGIEVGAEVEWAATGAPDTERLAAWALPVGAVVLAARPSGPGGGDRLLLEVGDQPLVRHVVEAAAEGGCQVVHVVYAEEAVRQAVGKAAICVHDPGAGAGLGSALRLGLQSLPEQVAGALVMLGDQALVGSRTVRQLLRAWRCEGARPAVAVSQGGGWRPPLVVDRSLWPELTALAGDGGAGQLFERHPELLDTVFAGGRPEQADVRERYEKIVNLFPRSRRRDPS